MVSRCTPVRRWVARTPLPSATCSSTCTIFSSGRRDWKSAVPLRSECIVLHERQKIMRIPFSFLPLHPWGRRFPAPRMPYISQSEFMQQRSSSSHIVVPFRLQAVQPEPDTPAILIGQRGGETLGQFGPRGLLRHRDKMTLSRYAVSRALSARAISFCSSCSGGCSPTTESTTSP